MFGQEAGVAGHEIVPDCVTPSVRFVPSLVAGASITTVNGQVANVAVHVARKSPLVTPPEYELASKCPLAPEIAIGMPAIEHLTNDGVNVSALFHGPVLTGPVGPASVP